MGRNDHLNTTMKAAIIATPGKVVVEKVPLPEPKADEVRIKLEGSGVCTSNLPVFEGRDWFSYPLSPGNPGHEGWGIIDAMGEGVTNLSVGNRVAAISYNAYAEYDVAKAENIVLLPSFLDGKPFPGEALGCAMNIFSRSDIKKDQNVAVVGCGFMGLLLIQLIKAAGAKVIAISKRDFSLQSASPAGADELIKMDDHYEIMEKVKDITAGNMCERVIEATGVEWPLNLAIELTAERGKLIVAGFHQDGMRQVNMQLLNWRGIDMINAHERDTKQYVKGMQQAVDAIGNGSLDPFSFFTHSFHMKDAQEAFNYLQQRPDGFIKGLILNN